MPKKQKEEEEEEEKEDGDHDDYHDDKVFKDNVKGSKKNKWVAI